MLILEEALVTQEHGVAHDFKGSPGPRQVTLLTHEAWMDVRLETGAELNWTLRRANLLLEEVPLRERTGFYLRIGDLFLKVTGENKPCERMDAQHPGLRAALTPSWRGGVTCRVVQSGTIHLGDRASLLQDQDFKAGRR